MAIYSALATVIAAGINSANSGVDSKTQVPAQPAGAPTNPAAALQVPKTPDVAKSVNVGEILNSAPEDKTVKPPDAQADTAKKPETKTTDILGAVAQALASPGVMELLGLTPQRPNTVVLPSPGGPAGGQVVGGFALPRHSIGDIINSIPRAYGR